ncbi:MAG: ASCH domain-containing protein [Pyrinomonadaceae bacterium]
MNHSEEIKQFWSEFATGRDDVDRNTFFQVWHFGNTDRLATELLDLVLQGKKYGTGALPFEFETEPENTPTVGTYSVVTDFAGRPKCVVRTSRVRILRFNEVDAEHAFAEGEGDQSLEYWRGVHWDYFSRQCIEFGREPSQTMDVICEEFKLLYPSANRK